MNPFAEKKIVYFGTPEFVVYPLKKLIEHNFTVSAVITAPDKPAGRGLQIRFSDVKQFALDHHLTILQPESLKSEDFIKTLSDIEPDLQIVVAFRKLPEIIWKLPKFGTFNLHASILPDYRGAAPINWAIINGEKETGVTTFFINDKIDEGDIIATQKISIEMSDNAQSVHNKLAAIGSDLILDTVYRIFENKITTQKQNSTEFIKTAPKLSREICKINWLDNGLKIQNFIRGLSPYPAAWTFLQNKTLKIFDSIFEKTDDNTEPGTIVTDYKSVFKIKVIDGYIFVNELQIEGKKRMFVEEFLRGYREENVKIN